MNLKIYVLFVSICCILENLYVYSESSLSPSSLNQNILSRSCDLNTSRDGRSAGKATHVHAECKYDEKSQEYFYKITWQVPVQSKTDVSSYMIVITYDSIIKSCFRVPETTFKLLFNKTSGFQKNKKMKFGVIPQPIVRIGGKFDKPLVPSPPCPPKLRMHSLPNDLIEIGGNYTFNCNFYQRPVRDVTIQWFFTVDSVNCQDRKRLNNSKHISISMNQRTLKIISAQKEHFGCYVVKVHDFSGSILEERGYLHLKRYLTLQKDDKIIRLSQIILIILVALLIFVTLGVIIWVCCKYNRKYFHTPTYDSVNNMKVYLSHAAEKDNDKKQMRKFARMIKLYNIDVIIDLCADFSINCEGGICRWVTNNIAMADVIMVVLTSSYLNALKSYNEETNNNNDEDSIHKKVHLEYDLLINKSYNSLKTKKLIIVAKGVKPNEFPSAFKNYLSCDFPSSLGITASKDKLDKKFRKVLSAILPEGTKEISL